MVCWIINQSTGIYRSEPPCEGSLHQAFRCCCHRSSRGRNVIGRKLAAKHGDGLCAFREDCALHRELPLWRGIPVSNYLAFYFSCLCRNFVLRLLGKVGVNSRPCATYPHPPLLSPIARWIPDKFGQKKKEGGVWEERAALVESTACRFTLYEEWEATPQLFGEDMDGIWEST